MPGTKAWIKELRLPSSFKTCLKRASLVGIPKVCPPPYFSTSAEGAERSDAKNLPDDAVKTRVAALERTEDTENRAQFTNGIDAGAGGHLVYRQVDG